MSRLHDDENEVLELLGQAADKFQKLHQEHGSDLQEFVLAIHAAQNIVLSRVGVRAKRKYEAGAPKKQPVGFAPQADD